MHTNKSISVEQWAQEIFTRFPKIWDEILPTLNEITAGGKLEVIIFYDIFSNRQSSFQSKQLSKICQRLKVINEYLASHDAQDLIIQYHDYLVAKNVPLHTTENASPLDKVICERNKQEWQQNCQGTGIKEIDESEFKGIHLSNINGIGTIDRDEMFLKLVKRLPYGSIRTAVRYLLLPTLLEDIFPAAKQTTHRRISKVGHSEALKNILASDQATAEANGLKVNMQTDSKGNLISITFAIP